MFILLLKFFLGAIVSSAALLLALSYELVLCVLVPGLTPV